MPAFTDTSSASHPIPETAELESKREAEQERRRLAHDLHDDLGGRLIAAKLALSPLLGPAAPGAVPDTGPAQRTDRLLDEAIDALRRVLQDLRPPELDLGLVTALRHMAESYFQPGTACRFSSNRDEIDAPEDVTLGLLRICREALTNAAKHACASEVAVLLTQKASENGAQTLVLEIVDNGRGYAADADAGTAAGASILRRAQALGGTVERGAGAGRNGSGCHLRICVPISLPNGGEAARIAR